MILVVDNFDSFVHNLARYIRQLGQQTLILRNDDDRLDSLESLAPDAILISPGPKTPAESGKCIELVRQFAGKIPIIGVCLGHQVIVEAFGGRIVNASEPIHGRISNVVHWNHPMFAEIPTPFQACRYHSLAAERCTFPSDLEVTAESDDGQIMACAHATKPVIGIQFHPESILTEHGYTLLANTLDFCGLTAIRTGGNSIRSLSRKLEASCDH